MAPEKSNKTEDGCLIMSFGVIYWVRRLFISVIDENYASETSAVTASSGHLRWATREYQ